LTQATSKPGPCQVRSKTQSPCLHRAVVEIGGIPFCEACAREQEAYFAIGELTQEMPDLRGELRGEPLGKTLGETLDGMRRHRADSLVTEKRLDLPSVYETERPALTKSHVSGYEDRGPNKMGHMSEDARILIRAAKEVHAERHGPQTFLPGTRLSFLEAAKRTGIRSDRQRYYDAIDDLEYEGAIEWDPSARYARGDKHYLITQRGLDGVLGGAGGEHSKHFLTKNSDEIQRSMRVGARS
jgi:hypothetical protein